MTECVILVRNPSTDDVIGFETGPVGAGESLRRFPNFDEAVEWAERNHICQAWPYQIVELSEL